MGPAPTYSQSMTGVILRVMYKYVINIVNEWGQYRTQETDTNGPRPYKTNLRQNFTGDIIPKYNRFPDLLLPKPYTLIIYFPNIKP